MTDPAGARYAGRTAIVTGASRGIGLAVAERLVAEGGRVCVTARKQETLDEAVAALNAGRPEPVAIAVAGRADDPEHQADAVGRTVEAFGPLDLFVNNTGINPAYGPLLETDPAAARKTFDVNVLAPLGWLRVAMANGLARPGGAVVNVASIAGLRPAPGITLYGASKAALVSVTQSLAVELAPAVRVNAVAPAVVKTKFATALYEGREEDVAAAYPLRRLGDPADVAGAVAFLGSGDAAWITGQTLVIDGGLTLTGGV
ncbi:SDR family oxidoreductase [Jatrophihabitans sp. YIM 134969]